MWTLATMFSSPWTFYFYWRLSEYIAVDVLQHSACIYIHFTTFNWSSIFILYVLLSKSNIKWVFWYIFYIPKHKLYIFVSVMNLNLFEKLCFYPVTYVIYFMTELEYTRWPTHKITWLEENLIEKSTTSKK